ncbi:hypothetical protein E6W39_06715 [Kitasatospora acidiphila]|uniref:Uncharacterized protein n=1 Tax=Kitasatospora acidiphila TaxID=2567942 RepID=A0A540VZ26_9ACTN|nr:hypothetical protein [Kitasatospora acidiphila]TQF02026.1 hypothetical protein E6W39_06715 [Kitasatospora acidiphila]
MIERAWGRPIAELEKEAERRPVEDPHLRAVMQTRSYLATSSNSLAVHWERLHALTRPGRTPAFYDLDRISESALALRTNYAESNAALASIGHVIDARDAFLKAGGDQPAADRVRAATARTTQSRVRGLPSDRPAPPAAAVAAPAAANRR